MHSSNQAQFQELVEDVYIMYIQNAIRYELTACWSQAKTLRSLTRPHL